jgi:hypothetical protein
VEARLAQVIALTGYGNAFLLGTPLEGELEFTNSAFQYVRGVSFVTSGRAPSASIGGVSDWFKRAREAAFTRFWLAESQVLLLTRASDQAESWAPAWHRAGGRTEPDGRIWRVDYTGVAYTNTAKLVAPNVEEAAKELRGALEETLAVATEIGEKQWTNWFALALSQFDEAAPAARFHPDALPNVGYKHEARALFAAAVGGSVFGGMGSWNDVYVKDPNVDGRYRVASERLHRSLGGAFQAAVNSWPSPRAS